MEGEEKYFTLDIPQREGKEGYVGTLFSLFLRVGGIIGSGDFRETDLRIEYMTHFLISLIPGEKARKQIREQLNVEISTKMAELPPNADNDEKAKLRNMICLEYLGRVMDFADKHVGVSRENKIGFAVKPQS